MTNKMKRTATFIIGIFTMLISPLVFMMMWNWYVVPLGVIRLHYWLSFGFLMTIDFALVMPSQISSKSLKHDADHSYNLAIYGLSSVIYTALIGSAIHLLFF